MNHDIPAYGLWSLVIINSLVFILFAFSFIKPRTKTDWRSLGAFSAFILALFTEMYGFPLTIYFLSGWLSERYPQINIFSHEAGHLWETLFGLKVDPHWSPLHILSNVLIVLGFWLMASAWRILFEAQKKGQVATTGAYSYIRHPQYAGFILIMFGFLLQWPTIPTLVLFPILCWVYAKLAKAEERQVLSELGESYRAYQEQVPAFIPWLSRRSANDKTVPRVG